MKVIIDADACPKAVMSITQRVCQASDIELWTVASFNHKINSNHHITVGNASQEADIQILNLTQKGDIVITQDWGLASIVLAKGAGAISPTGRVFCDKTIDFLLEEREIKAKYRRGGGRTRGPQKRSNEDDIRFEKMFKGLIEEVIKGMSQG